MVSILLWWIFFPNILNTKCIAEGLKWIEIITACGGSSPVIMPNFALILLHTMAHKSNIEPGAFPSVRLDISFILCLDNTGAILRSHYCWCKLPKFQKCINVKGVCRFLHYLLFEGHAGVYLQCEGGLLWSLEGQYIVRDQTCVHTGDMLYNCALQASV